MLQQYMLDQGLRLVAGEVYDTITFVIVCL